MDKKRAFRTSESFINAAAYSVTKSLDGLCKLGPNAFYVNSKEDYCVDHDHLEEFYQSAHSYLPFVEKDDLSDDMAGIRPKSQAPGAPWQDFIIRNEEKRGLTNLINLIGIESPCLTASLAIAEYAIKTILTRSKTQKIMGKGLRKSSFAQYYISTIISLI